MSRCPFQFLVNIAPLVILPASLRKLLLSSASILRKKEYEFGINLHEQAQTFFLGYMGSLRIQEEKLDIRIQFVCALCLHFTKCEILLIHYNMLAF